MNTYQVIDEKNWERAMHCMVFRESVEPAFCVTFEADITNFRRKVKAQDLSFTLAFVYAVCKCANEIEAFRYRFLDGKVVLFEHIDTAFTYLNQDTGLFKVVNVPLRGSIQEYVETAGRIAREQKEYFTGPLEMMCSSVRLCPGLPIRISHIPIPEKRIMRRLCLTGGSIMRRTVRLSCLYLSRLIILLWMGYILDSLRIGFRNIWNHFRSGGLIMPKGHIA